MICIYLVLDLLIFNVSSNVKEVIKIGLDTTGNPIYLGAWDVSDILASNMLIISALLKTDLKRELCLLKSFIFLFYAIVFLAQIYNYHDIEIIGYTITLYIFFIMMFFKMEFSENE